MESKKRKELKNEIHKILWENTTIEQKCEDMEKLKNTLNMLNIEIGIADDEGGILGVFVSEDGKPEFAETTTKFLNYLKQRKKEFYSKLDKITSQVVFSTEKIKKDVLELAKEYEVNVEFSENNDVVINSFGTWLFFAEF